MLFAYVHRYLLIIIDQPYIAFRDIFEIYSISRSYKTGFVQLYKRAINISLENLVNECDFFIMSKSHEKYLTTLILRECVMKMYPCIVNR